MKSAKQAAEENQQSRRADLDRAIVYARANVDFAIGKWTTGMRTLKFTLIQNHTGVDTTAVVAAVVSYINESGLWRLAKDPVAADWIGPLHKYSVYVEIVIEPV